MDPLYYDPNASAKIFVPVDSVENMTDAQKKIVESMPLEDRGIQISDEDYKKKGYSAQTASEVLAEGKFVAGQGSNLSAMVEEDSIIAAAKRMEILEADRMKKRAERKRIEKETGVKFKVNEYDSDEADFEYRMEQQEKAEEEIREEQKRRAEEGDEDAAFNMEENSYDSELEAEFFGKCDP